MTAATRVHRRDQLEAGGVGDVVVGARDRDPAGLERLAQRFEDRAAELRQFVEEEHALVRERDLARPGMHAAADHGRDRGRVMRAAKRPALGQAAVVQQARDARNHAHVQDLRH